MSTPDYGKLKKLTAKRFVKYLITLQILTP